MREAEAINQDEALELGVIDVVAADVDELHARGRGARGRGRGQEASRCALADAERRQIEMPPLTRLFNMLADPNVAFLLVMAGLLGLYIELKQPGMIVPGVAGLALPRAGRDRVPDPAVLVGGPA